VQVPLPVVTSLSCCYLSARAGVQVPLPVVTSLSCCYLSVLLLPLRPSWGAGPAACARAEVQAGCAAGAVAAQQHERAALWRPQHGALRRASDQ
jgi:hypothetical protein